MPFTSRARRPAARTLALAGLCAAVVAAIPASASAASPTLWLCKPGQKANPCTPGLDVTQFTPTGKRLRVDRVTAAKEPEFDCFYVYPTVSNQRTPVATLRVDPELRSIALYQASRYSQHCRVYAPVYRQTTLAGLPAASEAEQLSPRGYADVRDAWREYLRKHNRGRGVVFVGHSQGTYMLRRLLQQEVDPRASLRAKLISAVLLGGDVTVKKGSDTGGDFKRIRACRSPTQTGCVVAFSTFNAAVPADAHFGRVPAAQAGTREILCTNPASLRGGAGPIDALQAAAEFAPGAISALIKATGLPKPPASTPWYGYPRAYQARCSSAGGADVLQITPRNGAPILKATPDAGWGVHLVDGNIALGNLVRLVATQAHAWKKGRL